MKFRFHRGSFEESMKTAFQVQGYAALEGVLSRICSAGFATSMRDLVLEYYGFDDRLQSACYIITHKNEGVVGFLWDI